mmetsp:Transcript_14435/g.23679  ORF Transcript_14435/g.23679 Transcript_14435/m.23679 type:complete len:186 (+) Transcript_14435:85-642(+)
MAHTPKGIYSAVGHDFNHNAKPAGMTSKHLRKWEFTRCRQGKDMQASPDLFYCFNRIKADGTAIENPFTSGGYPLSARSGQDTKRLSSAGNTPPSGLKGNPPLQSPSGASGYTRERRDPTSPRRAVVGRDVADWPRDWGRSNPKSPTLRGPQPRSPRTESDVGSVVSMTSSKDNRYAQGRRSRNS